MIKLTWAKQPNGDWYTLEGFDFSKITTVGVYFIWCEGNPSTNVRPGQGIIGARITAHKADPKIMRHKTTGTMRVTWAAVPAHQLDRVERYLADMYQPIEGDRFPDVEPLAVNLPGH
jgi:hypothetical protein